MVGIEAAAYTAAAYTALRFGGILGEDVYAAAGRDELSSVSHQHVGSVPGGGGQGFIAYVADNAHTDTLLYLGPGIAGVVCSQLNIALCRDGAALDLDAHLLGAGLAAYRSRGSAAVGIQQSSSTAGIGRGI